LKNKGKGGAKPKPKEGLHDGGIILGLRKEKRERERVGELQFTLTATSGNNRQKKKLGEKGVTKKGRLQEWLLKGKVGGKKEMEKEAIGASTYQRRKGGGGRKKGRKKSEEVPGNIRAEKVGVRTNPERGKKIIRG